MSANTAQSTQCTATVSKRYPTEPRGSWMDLGFLELFVGRVWGMVVGKSSVSGAPALQLQTTPSTVTSNIKASLDPKSFDPKKVTTPFRKALRLQQLTWPLSCLVFTVLVAPAAAMDNQIVMATYPMPDNYGVFVPEDPPVALRLPIGTIGTFILVAVGCMSSLARNMLGPLMGISSVLWFIMRNDAAVRPSFSWAVFGIWSIATLMYLSYQARRVALDKLYILLALMFAGICLCIVALVQKASIQGGLVTAIPPCTSFAAYAVAFCFPDRRPPLRGSAV